MADLFGLRRRLSRKGSNEPVNLTTRAKFAVDPKLIERQESARAALPENNCKRLIEPQTNG